jgi:hypothetical protein
VACLGDITLDVTGRRAGVAGVVPEPTRAILAELDALVVVDVGLVDAAGVASFEVATLGVASELALVLPFKKCEPTVHFMCRK